MKSVVKGSLSKSSNSFPVVGVGASAGGLDAFKRLVTAIPENSGMAFVLVQHLDPKHESLLPELLQRITTIPVLEITDDITVKPNHIYIIPGNKMMIANDSVLQLSPRSSNRNERHLPIDLFFTSLAEVHQSHSIGIVLSGTASDGTKGLKAIKDNGGITFAQSEESAAFDGMPQSAIQAGVVDFVLPPELIPPKLLEITKITNGNDATADDIPMQDEELFKQMLALLRIRQGTDFTYYKQTTIHRRILRRIALNKIEDTSEYLKFLRENKGEQDVLYQDLLIPVTSFFRDPKSFENLCTTVFPGIIKNKKEADPIRIWVAGCSTGQEAYSLAICLTEFLGNRYEKVQVFATDISEPAIAKARSGIYTKSEVDGLTPTRLQQFFTITNNSYQINRTIRDKCVFAVHNFLKDPPFGKLDVISCRNVLIYMEPYLQKKALTTFHYALNTFGFLMLGKSETIGSVPDHFGIAHKGDKIFCRKDVPAKYIITATQHSEQGMADLNLNLTSEKIRTDFQRTADNIMLSKYTPAGVVINEAMDIVHFRGKTINYLEQSDGKPSHNLFKMAKEGLAFELRNILHKVKKEKTSVTKENILIKENGSLRNITIEAMPLPDTIEPYYMVLFHEDAKRETSRGKEKKKRDNPSDLTSHVLRIEQLEKELSQLREDMRGITEDQEAANEELQSANEELLSGSEELQSLNEELETGKEELQSTNEELTVVNQEMLGLNEQVTVARNYAETIIATLREPLLVLDINLRVKTANKSFFRAFNISKKETEGKLIYELGDKQWNIPALRTLLENLLPNSQSFTDFEVSFNFPHLGERTMLLNASEIIHENRTEKLILISFGDITERRIVEKKILTNEQRFRNLLLQSPFAVALCKGEDMVIDLANDAMKEVWGKGKNVEGQSIFKLLNEISLEGYKKLLLDVYRTGQPYVGIEQLAVLERKGILTDTYFNFTYQPYREADHSISGIVCIAYEVTGQVLAKQKVQTSEHRYSEMISSSISLISVLEGADLIITVANDAILALWGKGKEIIGQPFLKVFPEIIEQGLGKVLQNVLATGETFNAYEMPIEIIRHGEKYLRYYTFSYQAQKNLEGKITGVISFAHEVTSQALANKKLKESEAKYRALISAAPVAIAVLTGRDLVIEKPNQTYLDMAGKDESIVGKPLAEAMPELKGQPFLQILDDVFTSGKPYQNFAAPGMVLKEGIVADGFYDISFTPLFNDEGKVYAILNIALNVTEQVLSRKKIEESEEQFSTMADNISQLAWMADEKGSIYWYNQRWYDYTGTTLEEMKGWGWQKVHHPDDVERVVHFVTEAWRKNVPFELTFPIRSVNGDYKWFLTRAQPIANADGVVIRWFGTNTDVTEQREVQSLLEYRKALLEAHNEASVDGLLLVDAKGKIISYNKRFIEIWNMPKFIVDAKDDDAALSFAMNQLVNPQEFLEQVKWLYENPKERTIDELKFTDGKVIERHGYPVMAPDGSYYAWSWTFRDITDVKKANTILRQSEENFRQLAELMPNKVSTADAAGNITYYSKNWEDYTGISREELYKEGYGMLMHPDEVEALTKRWQHSVETGDDFEVELRVRNKTGEYKWHLSRASAVIDEEGRITKWIGSMTEIQHQKEQREELEQEVAKRTYEWKMANEQLLQSNEDLQQFAHVASHDLREPLRKITTFANRLKDDTRTILSEKGSTYLSKIQSASDRLDDMIQGVLNYSMVNGSEINIEKIDLNEIIKSIEADLELMIQQKDATIKFDRLPQIEGAHVLIYQLFYNLVYNSLKFTKEDEKQVILISSRIIQSGLVDFAEIIVEDRGIGFEPEHSATIFIAFARLNSKDMFAGTGLGLTLCKKITERHGGTISATGAKNKGAVFTITLPLKQTRNNI